MDGLDFDTSNVSASARTPYLPPPSLLLKALDINALALSKSKVTVSVGGLKLLLETFIGLQSVDNDWYVARYPDVAGAIMADAVPSASHHFVKAGYFEGRLPADLPFDPIWYFSHYKDLASAYSASDFKGLKSHFESTGYFEGRAGTPGQLSDVEFWLNRSS